MDILVTLVALVLLIAGAWAGLSVLILAPVLAMFAAALSAQPVLASYTQIFMTAAGGFVISFFPLFLLGAIFGRVMEDSGAAQVLARTIAGWLGPGHAILAVILACAVLTYGGVSLFVVAFVAWPLARALFAETGTPARLVPATIAVGAFTFTMSALPGTPSIQNAIPMATFGTTVFAAPWLGAITGLVMLLLGFGWLSLRARQLAGEPAPGMPTHRPRLRRVPVMATVLPILSVIGVTLVMGSLVLPALDTSYLAEPRFGATELARLRGLWSVLVALTVAILLCLVLARPAEPIDSVNKGAEASLLPLFNTASLVGFGAVIAALPGFEAIRGALDALSGQNVVLSAAVTSGVLSAITGSASGGMSIALEVLGPELIGQAEAQGVSLALLHRVIAVATGVLDTLPHNGAVLTLLSICGMTHRQAYPDIFVAAVIGPLLACGVLIGLGMAFGAF